MLTSFCAYESSCTTALAVRLLLSHNNSGIKNMG